MSQSQSDVAKTIELMKSAFECPICLELLDNPVLTRCGHVFCCGCLLRTLNKKSLSVPCPLCKKTVSKRGLQELRLWSQIVTKLKLLPVAFASDVKDAAGQCNIIAAIDNDGHHNSCTANKQQLAKSGVFHQLQTTDSASEPDRKSFSLGSSRSVFVEKPSRQMSSVQNNVGKVNPLDPIASNQYSDMINEQRRVTKRMDEHTVASGDPYEYIGSPLTPKVRCRTRRGKQSRHSLDFNLFDDIETVESCVPKRDSRQSRGKSTSVVMRNKRKWKSDGADAEEAGENSCVTSDKEALTFITGDISNAEKYDLILSQSLRNAVHAEQLQSTGVSGSAAVLSGIVNEIQASNVGPARELLSESCRLRADDEDTQKYSIGDFVGSVQSNCVPIGLAHGTGDMEVDMQDSTSATDSKSMDEHLEYQLQRIGCKRLHDGDSAANSVFTNSGNDQLEIKDSTYWPDVAPSSSSTGVSSTNEEIPFAAYNTPEHNPHHRSLLHYPNQTADMASFGGVKAAVHNQPTTLVASESAFVGLPVAVVASADQISNVAEATAETDMQQLIVKVKRSRNHVVHISKNVQEGCREISQIIGRHSLDSEASSVSDSDLSEGDSTDSMEILTQMLEYEAPNPELQSKCRKYQRRRAVKSGHKYETSATVLQKSASPPVSGCDVAKFEVSCAFPVTEWQGQESVEQSNELPKRSLAQVPEEICMNTFPTLSLIENKENVPSEMKLPDSNCQLDENQSKGSFNFTSLFDEHFAAKSVNIATLDNVVNTALRAENIGVTINEINSSSVDMLMKKTRKTGDRKTFSLQVESTAEEKNCKLPLMTDSLEIMSVINEVADIFQQKTNSSSRSTSSTADEDLSTQEIEAYLNRDFPEREMFKVPTALKCRSDVKKNEKKNSAINAVKASEVPADYSEPSGGSMDEITLSSQSEHSCSVLDPQFAVQLPGCLESTDDLSEANQPAVLPEGVTLPQLSKKVQGVAAVSLSVYGESSSQQLLPQSLLRKEFDVEMDEFVNQSAASTVEWQGAGSENELNGENLSDSESEAAMGTPMSRRTVSPCSIRSTQSELLTTQQHNRLKQDVSNIESEIALLHAKLMAGSRADVPTSETDYLCDLEDDSDGADLQSTTDELAGQIVSEAEKLDIGVLNDSSKQLSNVVSGNVCRNDLLASRNNNKQHTSTSISKDSNPLPDSLIDQLQNEFEMDQNEGVDFIVGTGAFKLQNELDLNVDLDNEDEANVCTFNETVDKLVGPDADRGTMNQPRSKLTKQRDEERERSSVSGEISNDQTKVKEANADLVVRTSVQTKSSIRDDVDIDSSSDSEDDLFVSPAMLQNYDEVDEIPASFESDTPEPGQPEAKINASVKPVDILDVSRVYSGIIPGGGNTEIDERSTLNQKVAPSASTEDGSSLDTTIDCGQGNRIAPEEIITISSSPLSSVPSHSTSDFALGQEKLLNRYPSSSPDFANRRPLNSLLNQTKSKSPAPDRFPKMPHWTIVASSISKDTDQPFVDALVSNLGCRFVPKFVYGTTHVLVKPVCEGSRRCFRTLKYFQGVAHKTWVLSVDWARDSIVKQKLMPPEKYEILGDAAVDEDHCGPTKARLSSTPLLLHFEVCCFGAYEDLTPDDLRGLLKACGANIVYDPMMFTYDVTMNQLIIVDSMPSGDKDVRKLHDVSRRYRAPVVIKDWLLDSVGTFDVKPLNPYLVTPWSTSRMSVS